MKKQTLILIVTLFALFSNTTLMAQPAPLIPMRDFPQPGKGRISYFARWHPIGLHATLEKPTEHFRSGNWKAR